MSENWSLNLPFWSLSGTRSHFPSSQWRVIFFPLLRQCQYTVCIADVEIGNMVPIICIKLTSVLLIFGGRIYSHWSLKFGELIQENQNTVSDPLYFREIIFCFVSAIPFPLS